MVADLAAAVGNRVDEFFGAWTLSADTNSLPASTPPAETVLPDTAAADTENTEYLLPALDKKTQDWWS